MFKLPWLIFHLYSMSICENSKSHLVYILCTGYIRLWQTRLNILISVIFVDDTDDEFGGYLSVKYYAKFMRAIVVCTLILVCESRTEMRIHVRELHDVRRHCDRLDHRKFRSSYKYHRCNHLLLVHWPLPQRHRKNPTGKSSNTLTMPKGVVALSAAAWLR